MNTSQTPRSHWLFGYGSLLSHDSRKRFSDINDTLIPARLTGWKRSWQTRYEDEKQTYVAASIQDNSVINGAFVAMDRFNEDLHQRERGYRFSQISAHDIELIDAAATHKTNVQYWICQSLILTKANLEHPICQSYVDTCIVGCLENGGEAFAIEFIETTHHWNHGWINDRSNPRYPRAANINADKIEHIDHLLDQAKILRHRT